MVTFSSFRQLALSFPETREEPHFEKTSFRIKKKIFATFDIKTNKACLKFSEIDQSVFITAGKNRIYAVDNNWGQQGWTFIEIDKIDIELLNDALTTAYCAIAPQKLAILVRPNM